MPGTEKPFEREGVVGLGVAAEKERPGSELIGREEDGTFAREVEEEATGLVGAFGFASS